MTEYEHGEILVFVRTIPSPDAVTTEITLLRVYRVEV